MNNNTKRQASKAGSWYEGDSKTLTESIKSFLDKASKFETSSLIKGLIVPHAGYFYSGPTAAYSYININPNKYKRVFVLGPSHHSGFEGCGLTKCSTIETPIGDIKVDREIVDKLKSLKGFEEIDKETDEDEHSLEMQFPFLKYMFGINNFTLIPIMVGFTNEVSEQYFGKILSEYYKQDENLYIISSDFCHWGTRF